MHYNTNLKNIIAKSYSICCAGEHETARLPYRTKLDLSITTEVNSNSFVYDEVPQLL
jgi:hypothetical protein